MAPPTISLLIIHGTPRRCQKSGSRLPLLVGDFGEINCIHGRLNTPVSCRVPRWTARHSLLPVWWTHSGGVNDINLINWRHRPSPYTHRASGSERHRRILQTNGRNCGHKKFLLPYKLWWFLSRHVKSERWNTDLPAKFSPVEDLDLISLRLTGGEPRRK